jgi:hypothetical protein
MSRLSDRGSHLPFPPLHADNYLTQAHNQSMNNHQNLEVFLVPVPCSLIPIPKKYTPLSIFIFRADYYASGEENEARKVKNTRIMTQ